MFEFLRYRMSRRLLRLRWFLILTLQAGVVVVAMWLALLLRFDFSIPEGYPDHPFWTSAVYAVTYLVGLWWTSAITGLWRYVTLRDAIRIGQGCVLAATALYLANLGSPTRLWLPRSVSLMTAMLSFLGLCGLRIVVRLLREAVTPGENPDGLRRLALLGAGDAGFQIAREVLEKQQHRYQLVGFLDDDPAKHGQSILGVTVLGPLSDLERIQSEQDVEVVIIAMPSAGGRMIRSLQSECLRLGIEANSLPGMSSIIDGKVNISHVRPVSLEDLLRRPLAELDLDEISRFLRGKSVLVTGAGGSIGSELCRQVARFRPAQILLLDQAETPLYQVELWLREHFPDLRAVPVLASITDAALLRPHFAAGIDVVLHAAAYKHVPLLEVNPHQAFYNNVLGTREIARLAVEAEVGSFVMVSTDKAVRPSSIMGASKRICELFLQGMSEAGGTTRFKTVRFGNVLGSNGSVIPRFQEQIRAGGPVTVTHENITRFFMTIPEATQLILQAATLGQGGEIFILEMGEPVKIVDLARDLIRLSGLVPDEDIPIVFTGLRPGEKMYEELLLDEESEQDVVHPSILMGRSRLRDPTGFVRRVDDLLDGPPLDDQGIRDAFANLIDEHKLQLRCDAAPDAAGVAPQAIP